jgi:hypothetical protein
VLFTFIHIYIEHFPFASHNSPYLCWFTGRFQNSNFYSTADLELVNLPTLLKTSAGWPPCAAEAKNRLAAVGSLQNVPQRASPGTDPVHPGLIVKVSYAVRPLSQRTNITSSWNCTLQMLNTCHHPLEGIYMIDKHWQMSLEVWKQIVCVKHV